jgi:SAM-dependent methyltransferase
MRQNIYDQAEFFAGYQRMRRREAGMNAALEQPAMRALLPPAAGLRVIDLGCGDGRLSRELAAAGAASVLGVDPSARMLAGAVKAAGAAGAVGAREDRVRYVRAFAEDITLPAGCADLVVSSLAFHYVADLAALLGRIGQWLRPGGQLVASMEHPAVTAARDYSDEGRRVTTWFVGGVIKYHRRVATVVNDCVGAGLVLERVAEPAPSAAVLRERPDLAGHRRRPRLLLIAARRPGGRDYAARPA